MGDPNDRSDSSHPENLRQTAEWQPAESSRDEAGQDTPAQEAVSPGQDSAKYPQQVGRYRIEKVLGEGGFGVVYRGYDDMLKRPVAVKVPHHRLVDSPEAIESYLEEAQVVASLDHPHIVPVHDVGKTEGGLCYVVSQFVEGSDLATRMKGARLSQNEAAEIAAAVAEALHYTHTKGLVHRDIKPSNILLDASGKPRVADFGLALKEETFGKGPQVAGTPAYMSPEQARGEGHRIDGRSDIFSLGIVMYEMLTGRRPFRGDSRNELLDQVTNREVRPPRQWDDTIPKELERICLKSLAKRASERYTTAKDMADDLRRFLDSVRNRSSPSEDRRRTAGPENLLHLVWSSLDSNLQDAFSLAYNKKQREGSNRISTRDFFQALARIGDGDLRTLFDSLPEGSLPTPVDPDVGMDRHVLQEQPLLSDCVHDSLDQFLKSGPLPRKLSPVDVFVDIGKHGHGPSVARLREHGVTPEEIEQRVKKYKLSIIRRKKA